MAAGVMIMLPYFLLGPTSCALDTTHAAWGWDGTEVCFDMSSCRVCTVKALGEIAAMQRTAVFTILGVKLLYANSFRSLTSCTTLRYE